MRGGIFAGKTGARLRSGLPITEILKFYDIILVISFLGFSIYRDFEISGHNLGNRFFRFFFVYRDFRGEQGILGNCR